MNFSVAICTHNGANFIEEQLRSIIEQSLPVHEIVISDDASNDETISVINQVIQNLESCSAISIKLISNSEPLGISRNFQSCIAATTNDWVFLSDQDDVWAKNKVETFSYLIQKFPSKTLFCSDAELVDSDGDSLGYSLFNSLNISKREIIRISQGDAFPVLLRRNLATGATFLVHKSLFKRAIPFPNEWIHDEWLAIVASINSEFFQLTESTISYRQHSSNSIGAKRLSFRNKISKYREPRNERNAHLVGRAQILRSYLADKQHSPSSTQMYALCGKYLEFHLKRNNLPIRRGLRLAPIIQMVISREYEKFGLGFKDAFKDFVQPDS